MKFSSCNRLARDLLFPYEYMGGLFCRCIQPMHKKVHSLVFLEQDFTYFFYFETLTNRLSSDSRGFETLLNLDFRHGDCACVCTPKNVCLNLINKNYKLWTLFFSFWCAELTSRKTFLLPDYFLLIFSHSYDHFRL